MILCVFQWKKTSVFMATMGLKVLGNLGQFCSMGWECRRDVLSTQGLGIG